MTTKAPSKTGLPEAIVFYCKDCEKIAPVSRVGSLYVYTCDVCGTKNVAFGTVRSIQRFFHLKEKQADEEIPAADDEPVNTTV